MEVKKKKRYNTRQTKAAYSQKINRIITIRAELKEYMIKTFGWNGLFGFYSNKHLIPLAYSEAMKDYSKKLVNLKMAKKRLDDRQLKVKKIGDYVEEFMGVKIRIWASNKNEKEKQFLGKCILSKYVFENIEKAGGRHIRNYLDNTDKIARSTPCMWRKKLTRSFSTHPERKELYHNFLVFIKEKELAGNSLN
jgi:hypothetical protein